MKWIVVVLMLCDKPIDLTLFNVEKKVYIEHLNKKEINKIIGDDETKAIIIKPMKGLFCA